MIRKFKHKSKSTLIVSEKTDCYEVTKGGYPGFWYLPKEVVENSNDWEEITSNEERITYPIGTRVIDNNQQIAPNILEKTIVGWKFIPQKHGEYFTLNVDESQIGEGKRFGIVKQGSHGQVCDCSNPNHFGTCERQRMLDKEPKWRITAFKCISNKIHRTLNDRGFYEFGTYDTSEQTLDQMLKNKHYEIYSVEVLQGSRWVEFKIGDSVKYIKFLIPGVVEKPTKIIGFLMTEKDGLLTQTQDGSQLPVDCFALTLKPLFQLPDESGKMIDIFCGDRYWFPSADFTKVSSIKVSELQSSTTLPNWFATQKAASQYIDLNQKKYSKQQIFDALEDVCFNTNDDREMFWTKLGL